MDPSHARMYRRAEIEVITSQILNKEYPDGIKIPISIDRIVERHELVEDIIPIPLLQDKYKIDAVLYRKANGYFDILVDEDTFTFRAARASFSMAHELGHIVLHREICDNCKTIEDVIALNIRIKKSYRFIEGNVNYFAGALLIPRRTLPEHTAELYEGLVKLYGYDFDLILSKLRSRLAERYLVNSQAMEIRLKLLQLDKKALVALNAASPYLDP